MSAERRAVLVAALGFLPLPVATSALRALHAWLDSWAGIGHVVVGVQRHGFRVSLRSVAVDGWAASFHGDPGTSASSYATASTPWEAVHGAAWAVMRRRDSVAP